MPHVINYADADPPVESVTLELTPQEFATLATINFTALSCGHPLWKTVDDAIEALPDGLRGKLRLLQGEERLKVVDHLRNNFADWIKA